MSTKPAVPIIMHLAHTGGTTMQQIIERQYRHEDIYYIYTKYDDPVNRLMHMTEPERSRYALVIGHLRYGLHRWIPGQSTYITWVRNPIERILSSYYYNTRKPNLKNHRAYSDGRITWERHLRQHWHSIAQIAPIIGGDDNVLLARVMEDVNLPENAVEQAITHLERDFLLVGLTEQYDEMLLLMRQHLGWQQPIFYVRQNVGMNRPQFADLAPEDKKRIEKAAELEFPLYQYACQRFAKELDRYEGDFEKDLAEFKRLNKEYSVRFLAHQQRIERVKRSLRRIKRWVKGQYK